MKIDHVVGRVSQAAGGLADAYVRALARAQDSRGDVARIFRVDDSAPPNANDVTAVSVRRVAAPGTAERALLESPGEPVTTDGLLRALLDERGVDVLHCHAARSLGATVRAAAMRRRIPYVLHLRDDDAEGFEAGAWGVPAGGIGRLRAAILGSKRVLTDAALILVASAAQGDRILKENPHGRVEMLPEGVDAARFRTGDRARGRLRLGLPADSPVLLTIAPIDPAQNQEVLVDVLVTAKSAHAVLAGPTGTSGYDAKIRIRARAFGVEERMHIVGTAAFGSSSLPDLYAAADALVLPSGNSTGDSVVLQAWAACVPVVAASAGNLGDFINGDTGLVVMTTDGKALAAAVSRILADETLRGGLAGRAVRLVANRYDWSAVAARVDLLYREVGAGSRA